MPESESEANQDLALLQSLQPPPSKVELKDIPWTVPSEHGEECLASGIQGAVCNSVAGVEGGIILMLDDGA